MVKNPPASKRHRFNPWVGKVSSNPSLLFRAAESASPRNFSKVQILQPHPRTLEMETLGGTQKSMFPQTLQGILKHAEI